jgi:hypothetical protein
MNFVSKLQWSLNTILYSKGTVYKIIIIIIIIIYNTLLSWKYLEDLIFGIFPPSVAAFFEKGRFFSSSWLSLILQKRKFILWGEAVRISLGLWRRKFDVEDLNVLKQHTSVPCEIALMLVPSQGVLRDFWVSPISVVAAGKKSTYAKIFFFRG